MKAARRSRGVIQRRPTSDFADQALGQRQQGRDGSQLARRQRAVGARRGRASASPRAHPGSPCIRAPTRGTSPPRRSRVSALLRDARAAASSTTSRAIRGPICSSWSTRCKPTQCTLVPVRPGEITSQAGWSADTPREALAAVVDALQAAGIRVSLFVDPEDAPIRWAADVGADRVELYTEPFARAFERGADAGRDVVRRLRARPRSSRTRSALASTPATTSTSRTWCCFARCRIWTRCRSATRWSATRCSWASTAASANIWMSLAVNGKIWLWALGCGLSARMLNRKARSLKSRA